MAKLTIAALLALSVPNLEAELIENVYTPAELADAIALEKEGSNRSTAITAMDELRKVLIDTPEPAVYVVAEGKAITTRRSIASPGGVVDASSFPHGQVTLDELIESGHVVERG